MKTDTTEKGLESLIMRHMTGTNGLASTSGIVADTEPGKGGPGWIAGSPASYDREYAVDAEQLFAFLMATQPETTRRRRPAGHFPLSTGGIRLLISGHASPPL